MMAAKEKKTQLFDLCKKAAAIKQIKIASSSKDRQKTVGGIIKKKINGWTTTFLTLQSSRSASTCSLVCSPSCFDGILEKWFVQALKIFFSWKLLSLFLKISPLAVFCGLLKHTVTVK